MLGRLMTGNNISLVQYSTSALNCPAQERQGTSIPGASGSRLALSCLQSFCASGADICCVALLFWHDCLEDSWRLYLAILLFSLNT